MYKDYTEFNTTKCKCRDCSVGLVYNKVVQSIGNLLNPTYMLCGEAPGETEVEKGQPFCGRAGKILREKLIKYGLTMKNTVISNTIPCRPENNHFPTDSSLVTSCVNKWLLEEILLLKPKYLLLIGATPMRYVLGCTKKISEVRGQEFEVLHTMTPTDFTDKFSDRYNIRIRTMCTFHPSYILRQGTSILREYFGELCIGEFQTFWNKIYNDMGNPALLS